MFGEISKSEAEKTHAEEDSANDYGRSRHENLFPLQLRQDFYLLIFALSIPFFPRNHIICFLKPFS